MWFGMHPQCVEQCCGAKSPVESSDVLHLGSEQVDCFLVNALRRSNEPGDVGSPAFPFGEVRPARYRVRRIWRTEQFGDRFAEDVFEQSTSGRAGRSRVPGDQPLQMTRAQRASFVVLTRKGLGILGKLVERHVPLADLGLQQRTGARLSVAVCRPHGAPPPTAAGGFGAEAPSAGRARVVALPRRRYDADFSLPDEAQSEPKAYPGGGRVRVHWRCQVCRRRSTFRRTDRRRGDACVTALLVLRRRDG